MRTRYENFKIYGFLALVFFAILTTYCLFVIETTEVEVFTVTSLQRITSGDQQQTTSKWIVLTKTEAYENTDSLFYLKFNSSDLQGRLEIGKTYRAKVYGLRIPLLSMYKNIVTIEEQK